MEPKNKGKESTSTTTSLFLPQTFLSNNPNPKNNLKKESKEKPKSTK